MRIFLELSRYYRDAYPLEPGCVEIDINQAVRAMADGLGDKLDEYVVFPAFADCFMQYTENADLDVGIQLSCRAVEELKVNPAWNVEMDYGTAKWLYCARVVWYYKGRLSANMFRFYTLVDEDGKMLNIYTWAQPLQEFLRRDELSHEEYWQKSGATLPYLTPAMFAMSLINTSGVKVSEITERASRQQRRQAERTGKELPSDTYKILDLGYVRRTYKNTKPADDACEEAEHARKRLHLCRGHIARYLGDSKLFGKYNKVVWIPPTKKGDPNKGEAKRSYRIKKDKPC